MSRRVKVLLVVDSLESQAGTENQIVNLVPHFDKSRVDLFVACLEDGPRLQSLKPYANLLVFPVTRVHSFHGLREVLRLRREINRRQIDVVHTFMLRATIFGLLAARLSSCKMLLTSRRNMGYWYTPGKLRLVRLLNRITTRVLANSEGARESAMRFEHLPPGRVDILHNGVDLTRFQNATGEPALREQFGIPSNAPVIGIVANYRPVKNLPLFLRAAGIVHSSFPDAFFVLVGRGPQHQELEQLGAELGIRDRMIFTGDQNRLPDFLSCFQIACLSSDSEGFSNAILEYMAAGLPIVTTDVGGVREAILPGTTGLVVPTGDAPAFAEALLTLLRDDGFRRKMGVLARQRCEEHFAFPGIAREFETYYANLIAP